MIALLALLACGGDEPQTLAECVKIADPTALADCRLAQATRLLSDPTALAAAMADLDDTSHDLLIVRLAFQETKHAGRLCRTVRTEMGRTRCNRITGRPHLGGTQ